MLDGEETDRHEGNQAEGAQEYTRAVGAVIHGKLQVKSLGSLVTVMRDVGRCGSECSEGRICGLPVLVGQQVRFDLKFSIIAELRCENLTFRRSSSRTEGVSLMSG